MSEQEEASIVTDTTKFVGEIGLKVLQSELDDPNEWPTADARWDDLGNSSKWSCVRAGMKRIAELEARNSELEDAGRAIVEAWEFDEIGQVDGELIERMSCIIGEQP